MKEAQDNLDAVTNEKRIAALEMEIEQLSSQKEVLENLASKEELENLKTAYDAWASELGVTNSTQAEILKTIADYYTQIEKISLSLEANSAEGVAESNAESVIADLQAQWDDKVNDLRNQIINYKGDKGSIKYANLVSNYNKEVEKYQQMYGSASDRNLITENSEFFSDDANKLATATGHDTANGGSYLDTESANYVPMDRYYIEGNRLQKRSNAQPLSPGSNAFQEIQNNMSTKDWNKHAYAYSLQRNPNTGIWQQTNTEDWDSDGRNDLFNKDTTKGGSGGSLTQWAKDHPNTVLHDWWGGKNEHWTVTGDRGEVYDLQHYKRGTLGVPALVNELGTEAVVTPAGTVTALPTGTGVVPADITRNLWQLGGLAPAILRALGAYTPMNGGLANAGNTDNSLNIGVINMTVNADDTFDVNKWVAEVKRAADLNKNNK